MKAIMLACRPGAADVTVQGTTGDRTRRGWAMRRALALALALAAGPALALHPGERLDEVMAGKEPAFEAAGPRRMPMPGMRTTDGTEISLDELTDQVVVLSFVPEACGAPCADQQSALVRVQEAVNITPMRDMVTFLTVYPRRQTPGSGWAPVNWRPLTPDGSETVTALAGEFAVLSARNDGVPMIHVIDRGARHAGIFHGADFDRLSMVLYINGLTNVHPPKPGLIERLLALFE